MSGETTAETMPDRSPANVTTRRTFIGGAAATALALAAAPPAGALGLTARKRPPAVEAELATGWVRVLYGVVMAEGLTPPAAARFYHYTSLAMYETARPELPGYRTLARQLHGLDPLPHSSGQVDLNISVSEAVSTVALGLLPAASAASVATIEGHRDQVAAARSQAVAKIDARSRRHGRKAAEHLLKWIALDGYAEAASMPYTPDVGPALWKSTPPNFGTAIEPHWGLIRPAVLRTADEIEPEPPIPFSAEPGSPFHEQAMATYRQSSINTADQTAIARFWTDNPRVSGLPSGHWFLLLAQLAEAELDLDFGQTVDGFVRLGVAVHDAFLNCWTWKYRYNLIRPVSYIQDHVDPGWVTLVNTPQFPEYTSGHSVSSGAAEVVLTSMFGSFPFSDYTGEARGLAARSFTSFTDAANEAGISRLYGGIHYPMAIDIGLAEGRELGRLIDTRLRTGRPGRR